MRRPRRSWPKVIAITLVAVVALGSLYGFNLETRVADAKGAEADLDGLFSLSAVAEMEGALHEEGTLAIAYTIGFIEAEEFDALIVATDEARVGLQDEITYYAADDPLGTALREVDASLDGLDGHRASIASGEVDGDVTAPYRASIEATTAAIGAIRDRLVVPGTSAAALLAVDEARRASSDAVMAATAAALGQTDPSTVDEALARVDRAEVAFFDAAATGSVEALDSALAGPSAEAARAGVVAVAESESFDLFAWADVAAEWPLAYVDTETEFVETGLAVLETRATDAEAAAKTYAVVGGVTTLLAVLLTVVVARTLAVGPRRIEAASAIPSPPEGSTA